MKSNSTVSDNTQGSNPQERERDRLAAEAGNVFGKRLTWPELYVVADFILADHTAQLQALKQAVQDKHKKYIPNGSTEFIMSVEEKKIGYNQALTEVETLIDTHIARIKETK